MSILAAIFGFVRTILWRRTTLALENLALRQQLAVLRRSVKRPRLRQRDRAFWVLLRRLCPDWRSHLVLVQPDTVVRWHRRGFKLLWRWRSRNGGRPRIRREVIDLIRRMSRENVTWGVPRIQSELHLLGYEVADSTGGGTSVEGKGRRRPTHRRLAPPLPARRLTARDRLTKHAARCVFPVSSRSWQNSLALSHDRQPDEPSMPSGIGASERVKTPPTLPRMEYSARTGLD